VDKAIHYYQNFVKPYKKFRAPNDLEKAALLRLAEELTNSQDSDAAEDLQSKVYMVGRESGLEMKNWFMAIYEVLLGCSQGPRFGSFIKLYGVSKTVELIREKCL